MISRTTYQYIFTQVTLPPDLSWGILKGQGFQVNSTCDTFKHSGAMKFKSTQLKWIKHVK